MNKNELIIKLLALISLGIFIPAILVAPNLPKMFLPILKRLSKKTGSRPFCVKRSLAKLKKDRLIKITQSGDEMTLILTEKGKRRLLRNDIDRLAIPKAKKWDGKWRIILFDIPEHKKKAREALRDKLRNLGFYQFQKSCFIYPFECRDQIDFVCEFFEISRYVNYVLAEALDSQEGLRGYFNL